MKIVRFLFRKNLWTLDLLSAVGVGLLLGYLVMSDSDAGNKYAKTDWAAIFFGVLSYVIVFIPAVNLQKKISWMPSWAWMGIVGVLLQVIFIVLIGSRRTWEWKQQDWSTNSEAVLAFIPELARSVAIGWLAWGLFALTLIFTMRFLAFVVLAIYNLFQKRNARFSAQ